MDWICLLNSAYDIGYMLGYRFAEALMVLFVIGLILLIRFIIKKVKNHNGNKKR